MGVDRGINHQVSFPNNRARLSPWLGAFGALRGRRRCFGAAKKEAGVPAAAVAAGSLSWPLACFEAFRGASRIRKGWSFAPPPFPVLATFSAASRLWVVFWGLSIVPAPLEFFLFVLSPPRKAENLGIQEGGLPPFRGKVFPPFGEGGCHLPMAASGMRWGSRALAGGVCFLLSSAAVAALFLGSCPRGVAGPTFCFPFGSGGFEWPAPFSPAHGPPEGRNGRKRNPISNGRSGSPFPLLFPRFVVFWGRVRGGGVAEMLGPP